MDHVIQDTKDQKRDRRLPQTDKPEAAQFLYKSGSSTGFSMEWLCDRYTSVDQANGGTI
jgi:hypothetical protein